MDVIQMQEKLRLEKIPPCFFEIFQQIKDSYLEHAAEILAEEFITETLDSVHILIPYRKTVLDAARVIREEEAMCLLLCLLEEWVLRNESLPCMEYSALCGEGAAYDLFHIFAAIPRIPENLDYLRRHKVPEDVIALTMKEYDYCVELCMSQCGRPVFNFGRLNWINRLLHNRLIRIERFKYDFPGNYLTGVRVYRNQTGEVRVLADQLHIHKSGRVLGSVGHTDSDESFFSQIIESEDTIIGHCVTDGMVEKNLTKLSKKEWMLCLSEKDPVLRIHIPPDGSFDRETIHRAYERARTIFSECYPELDYKAFFCSSWLMSADLWEILKPTSNILGFQKDFVKIPWCSTGTLVFGFVFSTGAGIPADIGSLPEENSLQRGIKERYQSGGYIHEGAGFFLR